MPRKVILSEWDWVTSRDRVGLEQFWDPVLSRQKTFRGVIVRGRSQALKRSPGGIPDF